MQTFLPYPSFVESAKVLDNKRLGKQRVETAQILKALLQGGGWVHHPATKMWKGHEYRLAAYGITICQAWLARGFKDTQLSIFLELSKTLSDTGLPSWFGHESFHRAHQSNLVRKDPAFYRPLFPDVPNDLPYEWPLPLK